MSFLDNLFASSTSSSISGPVAVELPGTAEADIAASKNLLVTLAGAIATGSMKVILQAGTAVIGRLAANVGVNIGTVDIGVVGQLPASLGQKAMAASASFAIASDQSAVPTKTEVTADYDTAAGTQSVSMRGIALPASGGAVAGGTQTAPLRVDPTGTTAQPISDGGASITVDGSVTIGSSLPVGPNKIGSVDVAGLPSIPQLPATLGAKPSLQSMSVVLATDHATVLPQLPASVGAKPSVASLSVVLASDQVTQAVSLASALPAGNNSIGNVDVDTLPALPQLPASLGAKLSAASLSVALASDQSLAQQRDVVVTGTIAGLMQFLEVPLEGQSSVSFYANGTFVGVLNPQFQIGDVGPWTPAEWYNPNPPYTRSSATNCSGATNVSRSFVIPKGCGRVRVVCQDAYTSGSLACSLRATSGDGDGVSIASWFGSSAPTVGQKPAADSLPVVLATGGLPAGANSIGSVTLNAPSAATTATVPASASVVTLAASNTARVGLLVVNNSTSTSTLWLKLGSAASFSSWSVPIEPGGYWEMPLRSYSGIVTGIWGNSTGDAHVTETG
jgi:hypothetical protein